MAGVTDTVFRRFIKELGGCGLIKTEFTSADGLSRMRESKRKRYLTLLRRRAPYRGAALRLGPGHARRLRQDRARSRLRHRRSQPRLPGKARRRMQWRLRPVARPAADPNHLRSCPQVGHDPVHGEVPPGLERQSDRLRRTGKASRGLRPARPSRCMPAPANRDTAAMRAGSGSPPSRKRSRFPSSAMAISARRKMRPPWSRRPVATPS